MATDISTAAPKLMPPLACALRVPPRNTTTLSTTVSKKSPPTATTLSLSRF